MADNGNGKPTTTAGMLSSLSEKLVSALPPQFLALILINAAVLGFLFWFIDARAKHTAAVLNQLLQACLVNQGIKP
jgi:type VI protein secretion system component VasF